MEETLTVVQETLETADETGKITSTPIVPASIGEVKVAVTKTEENSRTYTLPQLDADIKGFDANIAQAQVQLDYWMNRQGELIALRDRVAVEAEKAVLTEVVAP